LDFIPFFSRNLRMDASFDFYSGIFNAHAEEFFMASEWFP
jgi:hypothetical protein